MFRHKTNLGKQKPLAISKGGLGSSELAVVISALGTVSSTQVDQPNGVALVAETGTVPKIKFPPTLKEILIDSVDNRKNRYYPNTTYQIQITNYNSFITYSAQVSAGSVSIVDDIVHLTTPGVSGDITLTINGRSIVFTVVDTPYFPYPTIVSPVNNAVTQPLTITFTNAGHANNTFFSKWQYTEWQLATDSGFSNVVKSTTSNTHKTTWQVSGLQLNTTYYLRCRYFYTSLGASDTWSSTVVFTTRAELLAITHAVESANKYTAEKLGGAPKCIRFSADNKRMFVGAYQLHTPKNASIAIGGCIVFRNDDGVWVEEARIVPLSSLLTAAQAGWAIDINSDGSVLAIAAKNKGNVNSSSGTIYFYERVMNFWTYRGFLNSPNSIANGNFGYSLEMTDDASRFIVGQISVPTTINGANTGVGYVYRKTVLANNTWSFTLEATLWPTGAITGDTVGCSVSITADGSRCIIGSQKSSAPNKAAIFVRSGTSWTQEANLTPTVVNGNANNFGGEVLISPDGTRAFVSARYATNTSPTTVNGKVFVFKRDGTNWTQEAVLIHANASLTGTSYFGVGLGCSYDGMLLSVGSLSSTLDTASRVVHIFFNNGIEWSLLQQILAPAEISVNDAYAACTEVSPDGTIVAISASGYDAGGITDAGICHIYQ